MSLHVLAYNLKRVLKILGIARTMKAVSSMRAGGPCCPQNARPGRAAACVAVFRRHYDTVGRDDRGIGCTSGVAASIE
jgi:hypothetical protein